MKKYEVTIGFMRPDADTIYQPFAVEASDANEALCRGLKNAHAFKKKNGMLGTVFVKEVEELPTPPNKEW